MAEREDTSGPAFPLYADAYSRRISDPVGQVDELHEWHPANDAAAKLWRCLESLRDIDNLLAGCETLPSDDDRRRRAKVLITPLYSFVTAVRDLATDLESNPESRSRLGDVQAAKLRGIREELSNSVPVDRDAALRAIRDKMSAHVDRKLRSLDARNLLSDAQVTVVGGWLHHALIALIDLVNMDAYAWSTDDSPDGYVALMAQEPFLVTLRIEDGQPAAIAGIQLSHSPRVEVSEHIMRVVRASQWMFAPGQPFIQLADEVS